MSTAFPVAPITDLYMPSLRIRLKGGKIGHVAKGVQYFVGNSFRGLRAMRAAHKLWADRDVHITKDGVLVITHWGKLIRRGHFRDTTGKVLNKDVEVEDLTWAQLQHFRATYRGVTYQIHTLHDDMVECARLGIWPKYEPKTKRLAHKEIWVPVKAQQMELKKTHPNFRISGYALGRNAACIQPMRDAGIPTSRIKRW